MREEIQDLGRELVLSSLGLLRTLQTHRGENQAVLAALERLRGLIDREIGRSGEPLRLQVVDDMLLLNGQRLRGHGPQAAAYAQLVSLLVQRRLGGVAFTRAVDTPTLRGWFEALSHRAETEEALEAMRLALDRHALSGIETLELRTLSDRDAHDHLRLGTLAFALETYARALLGFREFVLALRAERDPYRNRLNVVRVVQDLIDVASTRPDFLFRVMALAQERKAALGASYAEQHAANTCAYAVLLGALLKLDRTSLLDLGSAALLADAGGAVLGEDPGATQRALSGSEREGLKAQLTRAVQGALGAQGSDDSVMIRTIVAYEHHRPLVDERGQPTEPTHLHSRVVAVASAWDAMTSDRPWRPAMTASEALRTLREEAGRRFDPMLIGALEGLVRSYLLAPAPG